jgi:tryptophanyl-tRNA synthetase
VASGRGMEDLETEYATSGYARLKADLADAVVAFLESFQAGVRERLADPAEIDRQLAVGADKAQAVAAKTLDRVIERVGFLPRAR